MSPPRTAASMGDITMGQWMTAVNLVDWDRAVIMAKGHCLRDHGGKHVICGDSMEAVLKWDHDNPHAKFKCIRCERESEGKFVAETEDRVGGTIKNQDNVDVLEQIGEYP